MIRSCQKTKLLSNHKPAYYEEESITETIFFWEAETEPEDDTYYDDPYEDDYDDFYDDDDPNARYICVRQWDSDLRDHVYTYYPNTAKYCEIYLKEKGLFDDFLKWLGPCF